MRDKTIFKSKQSSMKKVLFIILVLVLIGGGLFLYFTISEKTKISEENKEIEKIEKEKITIDCGSDKTFISEDLGIAFCYPAKKKYANSEAYYETEVRKVGNKIYVAQDFGTGKIDIYDGQYVEVFRKDKNDSLEEAIRKRLLTGISSEECWVEEGERREGYPEDCIFIEPIMYSYPTGEDFDLRAMSKALRDSKCPPDYSVVNGIRYFMMDENHPDRFLFFSIGQYAIWLDPNYERPWQETVRVF